MHSGPVLFYEKQSLMGLGGGWGSDLNHQPPRLRADALSIMPPTLVLTSSPHSSQEKRIDTLTKRVELCSLFINPWYQCKLEPFEIIAMAVQRAQWSVHGKSENPIR